MTRLSQFLLDATLVLRDAGLSAEEAARRVERLRAALTQTDLDKARRALEVAKLPPRRIVLG